MELNNKKILITGGSSGIGYQLAKKLIFRGNSVAVLARREDRLQGLVEEVRGFEGRIYTYQGDVTDKGRVKDVISEINNRLGGIDIALLNSGIGRPEGIKKFKSENAFEVFNTNVFGVVNCIEMLLPVFLNQKEGVIAGVSSLADNRGYSGSGFYNGSKAAVTMILESLGAELKSYGIKVITIKPGFVKSEMTARNKFKMPFLMETDKAAEIIIKGLIKEKRIIQFPLITVLATKIIGCLPTRLYEYFEYKRLSGQN
jgi:short-subunit dehydrogenase